MSYISAVMREHDALANLTSESYDDLEIKGKANVRSLVLGAQLSPREDGAYFLIEAGGVSTKWRNSEKDTDYSLGASVGSTF
jgi:hypothetical protein